MFPAALKCRWASPMGFMYLSIQKRSPVMQCAKIAFWGGMGFALFVFEAVLVLVSLPPPRPGEISLVLTPPWGASPEAVIASAGGRTVGVATTIFAALSVDALPDDLLAAGALRVTRPDALPFLCNVEPQ